MAHDFAANEIRPVAWEYDRDGDWPEPVLKKDWELGLMNSHIAEAYGGPGVSYFDGALIGEELGWGCAAIATSIGATGCAAGRTGRPASEEIRAKCLAPVSDDPAGRCC